jgi:hypothetical protein
MRVAAGLGLAAAGIVLSACGSGQTPAPTAAGEIRALVHRFGKAEQAGALRRECRLAEPPHGGNCVYEDPSIRAKVKRKGGPPGGHLVGVKELKINGDRAYGVVEMSGGGGGYGVPFVELRRRWYMPILSGSDPGG